MYAWPWCQSPLHITGKCLTHCDSHLLSNARCHEPQHNSSDSNAQPESSGSHTTGKGASMSNADHVCDDPSAQRHLHTDIAQ